MAAAVPGRREHLAVADVEHARVEVDLRVAGAASSSAYIQCVVARRPSSRPAAASDEGARAERRQPGAAAVGGAQRVEHLVARALVVSAVGQPGQDHEVGALERLEAVAACRW